MSDYTEFDAKLLARIQRGNVTFVGIDHHMRNDAMRLVKPGHDAFRVTDRRLQALRKKGLIQFSRKTGWSSAAQEGK